MLVRTSIEVEHKVIDRENTLCKHRPIKLRTSVPGVYAYEAEMFHNSDRHSAACRESRTAFVVRYGGSMARTVVDPHFSVFRCTWSRKVSRGKELKGELEKEEEEEEEEEEVELEISSANGPSSMEDDRTSIVTNCDGRQCTGIMKSVTGMVPFYLSVGTAVVMGEPLCDDRDTSHGQMVLLQLFYEFCQKRKWRLVIAGISESYLAQVRNFEKTLQRPGNIVTVQFGEELIFDPANWRTMLRGRSNADLRKKINRAKRAGLTFHELLPEQLSGIDHTRHEMQHMRDQWLMHRNRKRRAFLCMARIFAEPLGRKWFYCRDAEGTMRGAVVLSRMDIHQGYLFEHLITTADAPTGTSEFLVWNTMRRMFQIEACRYISFAPDSSQSMMDEVSGYCPTILGRTTRAAFKWMLRHGWFNVDSKHRFRCKFRPVRSDKCYVIVYHGWAISPCDGIAILRAFNMLRSRPIAKELEQIRSDEQGALCSREQREDASVVAAAALVVEKAVSYP